MKYTVYKITNQINNKVYIGKHQTNNLNDDYMGSGKHLKRAIELYGIENFTKDILYVFDSEDAMNSKEAELVTEEFCSRDDTYNLCAGGKGGFNYINTNRLNNTGVRVVSETQKARVSAQFKAQNISKEWKAKRVQKIRERFGCKAFTNFKGKQHTEESKQKMSTSKKGTKTGGNNSYARTVVADGVVFSTIKEAAAKLGIGTGAVNYRLKRGIYTSL